MMKRYLLRLGIPTVLAVMLAGILLMLNNFELRTKVSATLVVTDSGQIKAYVDPGAALQAGDTLTLVQTPAGDITLRVDTVWTEPAARVARVSPLDGHTPRLAARLGGQTLVQAYYYSGQVRLRDLVFRRMLKPAGTGKALN